ncbi:putative holin [Pseudomonas sp. NPDC086581]|uniref:putative holin n=1 Tax=Pseudomonas sp. NPDC086581 TaxID=3364432 RepID=UPI0037FAB1E7
MAGGTISAPGLTAATTVAAALLGVQADGFLGVVAGAFCGAVVYMLNLQATPVLIKVALFAAAWVAGVLAAAPAAKGFTFLALGQAEIPHGVGALIASAIIVRLLQYLASTPLRKIIQDVRTWRGR